MENANIEKSNNAFKNVYTNYWFYWVDILTRA